MRDFKVGDIVEVVDLDSIDVPFNSPFGYIGLRGTIVNEPFSDKKNYYSCNIKTQDREVSFFRAKLKKIGESMSRYEELKGRIEDVEGWGKEADDILEEIYKETSSKTYFIGKDSVCCWNIAIPPYNRRGRIEIIARDDGYDYNRKPIKEFSYENQCGKNEAFKEALRWLLDNSEIGKKHEELQDDRQEQIEGIEENIKDLQKKVNKLKRR